MPSHVIKGDGFKTDSELERFQVIKYNTKETTKLDHAVEKSDIITKHYVVTEDENTANANKKPEK